jgi:MFS family permease
MSQELDPDINVANRASSPSTIGWLNQTVIGIGMASLCSDVGHEIATTAMPVMLVTVGGSAALLGLIEGLADGASSFAKLLSGLNSDRLRRRKPLAVVGYFMTAAGMAGLAFATQWWHVLLGRVFGWLGRGARTPVRNVLLAEASTPETYGRAFGFERAMDSAGAVIGPAFALLLMATLGLRWTFALTLIPGVVAALLIGFAVRERDHPPHPRARLWSGIKALPRDFRVLLCGVGFAGLGDFSNTLLILWATEAFATHYGLERAATIAMLFYVGYNVVYTCSCYVTGILADRLPRKWVLASGYTLAVVPALALLWPENSFWKFGVVFGASGLYMGVWETTETSTAASLLPSGLRGVGFGTLATVNGIGDLISSVVVGSLWALAPAWAMSYVIVTSLAGAAVIAQTHPAGPVAEATVG